MARRKGVGFAKTALGTVRKPSKVHKAGIFCAYPGCSGVPITFCAHCGKYFCEQHLSRSALHCTQLFCPSCNPKPISCNHEGCDKRGWRLCDQCGSMYCPQHLGEISNYIGIVLFRCLSCIADPTRRASDVKESKKLKVVEARKARRAEIHTLAQEFRLRNITGESIWLEGTTVVVLLSTSHIVYIEQDGNISVLPPGKRSERTEPTEMIIHAVRKALSFHLYPCLQVQKVSRKPRRR